MKLTALSAFLSLASTAQSVAQYRSARFLGFTA
jgi:hypothetical protein